MARARTGRRPVDRGARARGRPPSVDGAYWVNKHGLASSHAARHAAKGGIERDVLEALVERGLSVRAIGQELGVSYATVRHWLGRYGLQTRRASRRRALGASVVERDDGLATAECPRHGVTDFGRRHGGAWRCLKCRSEAVSERRRRVKATLVEEAGGCCVLCGYARTMVALQFHHVDPTAKAFHIARRGAARSLATTREEVNRCVLLCANCHAEIEAGVATLPKSGA